MRPLLGFFALLVLSGSPGRLFAGEVLAIRAGRLLDVAAGRALRDQVVLVEGGRITSVGPEVAIPEGATVIDLSGSTVMPGLVDAHTHLCARTRIEADRLGLDVLDMVLLDPPGYRALQGAAHARQMLEAGFTAVRDLGNAGAYVDVDLQRAVGEGLLVGPTMVVAGRSVTPFGGQFRARVDKKILENAEYLFADTRDELRKAVRENAFYGSNVLKLIPDSRKYSYSAEDLRFVVAEAREAGLPVAIHCQTATCERRAAEAAPASIEHAWTLEDRETIALIRKNGVTLVTTDFTEPVLRAFGWDEANARRIHAARVARLKRAYEAGLTIAFGSDVMVDVPGETRGTLAAGYVDSFVEAGIPADEILRIFTLHGARLLGLEKERGSLAAGAAADIIATIANPLDDPRALKAVHFVMKDGRVIVRRDRP